MEKVVLPYNHDQIINDLNEDDYYKYLNSNHILGGSLSDIITYQRRYFSHLSDDRNQTGAGLWSFISGLAKKISTLCFKIYFTRSSFIHIKCVE